MTHDPTDCPASCALCRWEREHPPRRKPEPIPPPTYGPWPPEEPTFEPAPSWAKRMAVLAFVLFVVSLVFAVKASVKP